MRPRSILIVPLRALFAVWHLLAMLAHAALDNPGVTDCLCPDYVQITARSAAGANDQFKEDNLGIHIKPTKNGTFHVSVETGTSGNAHVPTITLQGENGGPKVFEVVAWSHQADVPVTGLEFPLVIKITVPCANETGGIKICKLKKLLYGSCDTGDCGSGGTCQSGTGSPEGDVDPASEEPFEFSLSIGSNAHGDESTGLHFNAGPDTGISVNDFKIHSNGGYNRNGSTITTGTTETTLSEANGVVTVSIKTGNKPPFKTYEFTSDTTAKTLTLVETSCGQAPVTHQWKKLSGIFSYSAANGMRVKYASIEQDQDFIRIERHIIKEKVGGTEVTVSDERLHFKVHPWGERLIQRQIDPASANLVSIWTYGGPSDGAAYGKLMHHTRHDGHAETHSYGTGYHQIDYAGGRQVKTEWTGNDTTVTERMGTTIIARTKEIHKPDENEIEVRRFTEENESKALVTTTTYKPTGADSGGRPLLVVHPDGTATQYGYDRNPANDSECDPENNKTTLARGELDNGNIVNGTRTMTITNPQGQVIEEKTSDIATGIILAHTKGVLPDGHGRPTIIHHFPTSQGGNAYYETLSYTCCGLVSETDRHGVTTLHAYDALKRRIRSHRLGVTTEGVTTEIHHKGLVTETYRLTETVTAPLSSTLGGASGNLIGRETRNLAGTETDSETPSPTSTTAGTLVLSQSTETQYSPATGISRRVTTTVPGNHSQVEDYDLLGRLVKSTGALSPAMEYAYTVTSTGLLSARAYLDGANHREITGSQEDWAGRATAAGRLASLTSDTLIGDTGFDYSPITGQLIATTDADLVTTLYGYNAKGERTITAVNLDNNAAITYGTDQITRTKTFATNRSGTSIPVIRTETHVWQDNAAENSPTLVSYNERTPDGLKSWSWQIGSGETSTVSTVGLTRTVTTTRPDSTWSRDTYSGGRLHTTITYDSGNTQITSLTYGHDTLNRPSTTLDSRTGITTTTAYLSATSDYVQSVSENSTPARVNSYAYDSRGRQTTHTLPDTTQSHSTYTPRGETEARWGSQTYPEFRTYDYAGRLKTLRTKPNFTQGVPVNAGGSITTWNYYSDTGLLDEKLDHDSKGPKYTYTAAGRLHTRQWARGRLTVYAYTHGRLTGVAYYGSDALWQDYLAARDAWLELLDNQQATQQEIDEAEDEMEAARTAHDTAPDTTTPNLVYTHDALGRMKTVTRGGNNHAVYEYNADLQLHTERLQRETIDKTITRTYQTATNVTNHTVAGRPNGYTFANGSATWTYNNAGRHHSLSDGTETFTYGYLNERVESIGSPTISVWTVWDYGQNSPTYRSTEDSIGFEWYFDANAELNVLGQREFGTSIVWQLDPENLQYDSVHYDDLSRSYDSYGQLDGSTNFNNSADDRAYTYDSIGNRLTATADSDTTSYWADSAATQAGANSLNQYVKTTYPSSTTIASVHDFDGNLTSGPLPGADALNPGMPTPSSGTLTWDAENRLVKAVVNGTTVNYAYDHLSRLISRSEGVSPTTSTHYLYDGWNRIAEYTYADSQYTLAKTFLWGLDLAETPQGAGGVGGLLCQVDSGSNTRHYPAYDLNGNVIAYFDSTGQPAAHFQYDPFGNLTVDWESNAADFPYRFSTKPQDPITGLYYYLYRWYDPLTGRWPSRDPIEESGGINLYGFVLNDPVRRIDVLGMAADDSYTTKEEAIKAASNDVWLATSATVQAGLAEYTENTSDEQFIALFRMRKDKLLSRGNLHISGFEFARNQIRTVYGVEFWTFVCCNENETWAYNGLSKGKVPDEEVFFDFGVEGTTAAIPNNTWREMAAKECTFVHSHNVLVKRAKWDDNTLHRSSYVPSDTLSDADIGIIRDFNISVIAVSDDSFPKATIVE